MPMIVARGVAGIAAAARRARRPCWRAAVAQNKVPSERALEALVKATLLTFNDANVTGNFTVFHAKLAKPFRQQFTPERLQETFK